MSQPWVIGPSPIYIGGLNSSPAGCTFLGWTEDNGPNIEVTPSYEGMQNTLAGSRDEYDSSYQGQSARIAINLTRWNEPTATLLHAFHELGGIFAGAAVPDLPGTESAGAAGTLLMTEGQGVTVMMLAPYSLKAVYAAQLPGMRFPFCKVQSIREGPWGTKPRILTIVFEARRFFSPTGGSGGSLGNWSWTLWDRNVAGAGPVN